MKKLNKEYVKRVILLAIENHDVCRGYFNGFLNKEIKINVRLHYNILFKMGIMESNVVKLKGLDNYKIRVRDMINLDEVKSFSWSVVKEEYAIKIMDKSFIDYGETVIPIDIRKFFDIDYCKSGDKVNIIVLYKSKPYNGCISFENNFNRSKLKIDKELNKIISNKVNESNYSIEDNYLKVFFFKIGKNEYLIKIFIEI